MRSKKRDYFWNSLGSFLQSAISPILLIFITRLNGIDDSGLFSFALSLSVVFWAISLWGGRTYQVSDVKREFSTSSYVMVRFLASAIAVIVALVLCVASGYDLIKTAIILILVGFKVLESLADVLYGILQTHNRLYVAGKSLTIKAVLGLVCFIVVDILTDNILYSSAALLVVNAVVICLYDIRWVQTFNTINIQLNTVRVHIKEACVIMQCTMPVFLVMFLTMFSLNIPRYFLDQYHPEEIGYFGIMAMPITLLALFISFIIQPNIVNLSKLLSQNNIKQFHATVKKILFVTLVVSGIALLATWVAGIWAVDVIFAIDLNQFKLELIIMVLGAIAGALVSIYINILIVMRVFKWQLYTLLVTTILLGVLSPGVVERHAMFGGVCLFLVINSVQAIVTGLLYQYRIKKLMPNNVQ